MGLLMGWICLFTLIFLYMLPCLFAAYRKHLNTGPIFIINIFLGWTFLGWVICLAWACSNNTASATSANHNDGKNPPIHPFWTDKKGPPGDA